MMDRFHFAMHAGLLTAKLTFYSDGPAWVPHEASGRRRQSRNFIRDGKLANRIW
jgi:hypothetical protein